MGYIDLELSGKGTQSEIVDVETNLRSGPFAGYLGLGFGNVAAQQGLIGVVFDAGVILSGARAGSAAALDSGLEEIFRYFNITPNVAGNYEFLLPWPVVSVGIAIRPGR